MKNAFDVVALLGRWFIFAETEYFFSKKSRCASSIIASSGSYKSVMVERLCGVPFAFCSGFYLASDESFVVMTGRVWGRRYAIVDGRNPEAVDDTITSISAHSFKKMTAKYAKFTKLTNIQT